MRMSKDWCCIACHSLAPEYLIIQKVIHRIEVSHSERVLTLLDDHYAIRREPRLEFDTLPRETSVWNAFFPKVLAAYKASKRWHATCFPVFVSTWES